MLLLGDDLSSRAIENFCPDHMGTVSVNQPSGPIPLIFFTLFLPPPTLICLAMDPLPVAACATIQPKEWFDRETVNQSEMVEQSLFRDGG
mmetsp:Transcript_26995/g.74216  ORF Transcript_26995/g.74216 Transcript_26995/m.74216 type:complete len:90 (+) Transcript_26995:1369-1638(+)